MTDKITKWTLEHYAGAIDMMRRRAARLKTMGIDADSIIDIERMEHMFNDLRSALREAQIARQSAEMYKQIANNNAESLARSLARERVTYVLLKDIRDYAGCRLEPALCQRVTHVLECSPCMVMPIGEPKK